MAAKLKIDLQHPLDQAAKVANKVVEEMQSDFNDISKKFINEELISDLIKLARNSRIDDSPLIVKQKVRNVLKAHIRKSV